MSKNKIFRMLWIFLSLISASTALSQAKLEQVTLDIGDRFYSGENEINLKKLLEKVAPRLNLNLYSIQSVDVYLQSQDYFGFVHLDIGKTSSAKSYVGGDVSPFVPLKITFFRPQTSSEGQWLLQLKGYFIVDKVEVTLVNRRQGVQCNSTNLVARSTIVNWFAMDLNRTLHELTPDQRELIQLTSQVEQSSSELMALEESGAECVSYLLNAADVIEDFFKLQSKLLPIEKQFKYLKYEKRRLRRDEPEDLLIYEVLTTDFDALRQAVFRMDYVDPLFSIDSRNY